MKEQLKDKLLPLDQEQILHCKYKDCCQRYGSVNEYIEEFYKLNAKTNLQESKIRISFYSWIEGSNQ